MVSLKRKIPLEKSIVVSIKKYLKTIPNCFFFHTHGDMYSMPGLPDIVCCINGQFVGIEVKRPKIGKLSEHQKKVLMQLQGCGAVVFVAHSVDEVKQVIHGDGTIDKEQIRGMQPWL